MQLARGLDHMVNYYILLLVKRLTLTTTMMMLDLNYNDVINLNRRL